MSSTRQEEDLKQRFSDLYAGEPRVYRAPGRVNLIGEHTDYNDGFVMPAAIDLFTWVAASPREDRRLRVRSENYSDGVEADLDDPGLRARGHWSDYPLGVAVALERAGCHLRGADLLIRSEVPIGSGLSSSAALEVAVACALLASSGLSVDPTELAKLCQRAENDFVGMRCGIMDQFVSCHARAGHALMLDCRSLDYRLLPLAEEARLVICNSMVKHELATGEYNRRREQCESGVRHLAKSLAGARALRDVTIGELEQHKAVMPEVIYRRCRHVITENARVLAAADALGRGELFKFGQLMYESHISLRDDYEVSSKELDLLVEIAREADGVYGARMTGGGFGGCAVNLVRTESVEQFKLSVAARYEQLTGRVPDIYVSEAAAGAGPVII
jgi:galactokinase